MKTISAKQLNQEVLDALEELDRTGEEPILINSRGQKFVVVKEEDYLGLRETAYLLSSLKNPKFCKKLLKNHLISVETSKNWTNHLGGNRNGKASKETFPRRDNHSY